MIKKIFRLFDSLVICNVKFIALKLFHIKNFSFRFIHFISPAIYIDIQDNGNIILGSHLSIPFKIIIGVREHGILKIGNGTFINNNCHIIAHKEVVIGENVCIGPNVVIMDHDHIIKSDGVDKRNFISKSIEIGNGVWIGANVVILKGVKIGDNAVIGAGSIITKNVEANTIVVQKKENIKKMV